MRFQDWPNRLTAVIEEYKTIPFVWGESDCMQFAIKAAARLVDYDLVLSFAEANNYSTENEANQQLTEYFGGTYDGVFDSVFPSCYTRAFARRGDVCIVDYNGSTVCGIIDSSGRFAVCKGINGLFFVPIKYVTKVWGVD